MDISRKKKMSAMGSSKIMSNRMSLDPKQKNNLLNRKTDDIDMHIEKFKKQIKSGHFTYAACVTEHYIKSQ